jgi:hypothetical protein
LQAWLEASWAAGFDPAGALQLGNSVQGSRKWIGTPEAVVILRFFGVRAQLVEFLGELGGPIQGLSSVSKCEQFEQYDTFVS